MTISMLGLHCLNAVVDDYESAASILNDVRAASHCDITPGEVMATINEMLAEGLIAAFTLDPKTAAFILADVTTDRSSAILYRITTAGRKELAANWVDR
jgi:DNA-binding PadR family transcriptional regulator